MRQEPFAVLSSIVAALSIWASFGAIDRGPAAALRLAWPSLSGAMSPTTCAIASVVLAALCIILTVYDWVLDCGTPSTSPWPHLLNAYLVGFVAGLSLVTAWPLLQHPARDATPYVIALLIWPAAVCGFLGFSGLWGSVMRRMAERGSGVPLRLFSLLALWVAWWFLFPDVWAGHWTPCQLPGACVLLIAFVLAGGWLVPIRSAWRYVVPMPLAVITFGVMSTLLAIVY